MRSDSDEELVSCNALCLVCGGGKGDRGEASEGRTVPPRLRTSLPCTVGDVHMEKVEVEERLEFRGLILGWESDLDKGVADGRRSRWSSDRSGAQNSDTADSRSRKERTNSGETESKRILSSTGKTVAQRRFLSFQLCFHFNHPTALCSPQFKPVVATPLHLGFLSDLTLTNYDGTLAFPDRSPHGQLPL